MMTGKTVFIVCLLFALAQRAGSECLLLADVETCQDLPASKWLPVDDDSSKMLPAKALNLEVSPGNIFLGQTEVLTVNCSLSLSEVPTNMSYIMSLILSKSVAKENHQEKFLDLASVNVFTPNQIKRQPHFDGSVVGQINNDGVSLIAIEWSNPTDDHAGLFRCEVHGMDNLGYPTQMFQTKLVTSQQPDVELTEKVSQLQIQIESQNNLTNNQQVEISKLSALAQNQSNEINTLSSLSKSQSDEIKTLSSLSKSQSDEINTLSSLSKSQSDEINTLSSLSKSQSDEIKTLSSMSKSQSDEINKLTTLGNSQADKINSLSSLSQNQSNEINKLLSLTKMQSQTISDQQSQLDKQSQTMSAQQLQLNKQSVRYVMMASKLNINITDFPFHMSSSYNGHYYLLSKTMWKDSTVSAQTCKDYGGYLAQINNDNENQFVKDFLNQRTVSYGVLISGTDSQHEGRWTYTDTDTDLVFYDWESAQPGGGQSENCIMMKMYVKNPWRWHDYSCINSYSNRKFLCELDLETV